MTRYQTWINSGGFFHGDRLGSDEGCAVGKLVGLDPGDITEAPLGIFVGATVVCIGGEDLVLIDGRYTSTEGTSEVSEVGSEFI